MRRFIILLAGISFILGTSMALGPCPPQQFYGTVMINGNPAPVGLLVEGKISGIVVGNTTTNEGWYGNSDIFYITSCSAQENTKIKFYLKGNYGGENMFYPYSSTRGNISLETVCGNAICEPGEDNSNCCTDCGCLSGYSCSSNVCTSTSSGGDDGGDDGGSSGGGGFIVTKSTCGDGFCYSDEDCSTCPEDCGCCPSECQFDSECNDNDECTIDICVSEGECTGECLYNQVPCQDNDGCCPDACGTVNDNDCVEVQTTSGGSNNPTPITPTGSGDGSPTGQETGTGLTAFAALPSEIIPIVSGGGIALLIAGVFYLFFWRKR